MTARLIEPALPFALAAALSGCGPEGTAQSAPAPLAVPESFHALGTEPFWGLSVQGRTARYSTPEIPEAIATGVTRKTAGGADTVSGEIDRIRFVLTVRPERCSDGMSDRVYPFAAQLRIGDQDLRGCAAAK